MIITFQLCTASHLPGSPNTTGMPFLSQGFTQISNKGKKTEVGSEVAEEGLLYDYDMI